MIRLGNLQNPYSNDKTRPAEVVLSEHAKQLQRLVLTLVGLQTHFLLNFDAEIVSVLNTRNPKCDRHSDLKLSLLILH